ncbi:hypothetical protein J6S39_00190 [Candidatus Saccharibacteria bacterium]|nr:hypothetical protein [Candidatus Saccharibacteria bacterium]
MTNKKSNKKTSIWQHIKHYIKSPDFVVLLILLATTLLVLLPLLSAHSYMLGHDSKYHIETIIGLEKGTLWNFFNIKVIPDFAGNLGYGAGIFYPQFPHYLAAVIFHIFKGIGLGPIAAIKIVYIMVVFFSGYFMYRFLRHSFKRRTPSLLAAILYMTAPYFMSDILVRDAMNETYVFLFIPVALFGFQSLVEKNYRRFLILFTIGYIGLVNTHLVLTMHFTIFFALAALFFVKDWFNVRSIKYIIISIALVALSSVFFLVPMLQHKNAANYEVFNGGMYTRESVAGGAMRLSDHLSGLYTGDPTEASVVLFSSIFAIALAAFAVFRYKNITSSKNKKVLLVFGITFCILAVFVSGEFMPWLQLPEFLAAIQFPWRAVTFLSVGLTLLAGLALDHLKVRAFSPISIVCIICCIGYAAFIQGSVINITDSYDTASLSARTKILYWDYYPVILTDKIKDFEPDRDQKALVTNGKATISEFSNTPTLLSFRASDISEPTTIEIPKIYYLGYEITTDSGGRLPYTESTNGLIEFTLDHNTTISVKYVNTRAGQIASVVSGLTLIGFGIYALTPREIWYNKLNAKTKV